MRRLILLASCASACQTDFSVDGPPYVLVDQLDQMTRGEKDKAIERLGRPLDTRLAMPPPLFRTCTPAQRQTMIDELKK